MISLVLYIMFGLGLDLFSRHLFQARLRVSNKVDQLLPKLRAFVMLYRRGQWVVNWNRYISQA